MRREIPNEILVRLVQRFAATATETRQVARRLSDLMPTRLAAIKSEHRRLAGAAAAERRALSDQRWLDLIEELVDMESRSHQARVQYETHLMLFEARRSLRGVRARLPSRSGRLPNSGQ